MITARISVSVAAAVVLMIIAGAPAFSQASSPSDLQGEIMHFQDQLNQTKTVFNQERINESSDERLMRRLKQGGPHNLKAEATLSERIDQEKFVEFEAQNNMHNLEGWVEYDQGRMQHALMNAQYQQHNAYEASIDQEVARRNAYSGPAIASSGSAPWGTNYGYYGGYGGGHWHSYPTVHWHSSGGGSHGGSAHRR